MAKKWAADGKVQILCLQEHNLHPDKEDEHIRLAQACGFTAVIGYAAAAADGVHRGGSMVMLNEQDTQLKRTHFKEGSITRVSLEWQGREYDIASIYAPSDSSKRIDFFSHLAQRLTKHTIAGGDWNCVTDVTLDVKSRNPLTYSNIGAGQLVKVCEKFNIYDYRRDQLGTSFEATRTGSTATGVTATRLDRWLIPSHKDFDSTLWDIHVQPELVWSKENSDHLPVVLTIEPSKGKKGSDRQTIREEIIFKPEMQQEIIRLSNKAYEGGAKNYKKWEKSNNMIRQYLLGETAKLRKKEKTETKRARSQLKIFTQSANTYGYTEENFARIKEIKAQIFTLENPEAPQLADAARAKSMTDRSESCTKAYFKTYKAAGKQQWINTVFKARWEEGKEPVKTGAHTKDPKEISGELKKYYQMLLSEKNTHSDARAPIMARLKRRRITKVSAKEMDKDIQDEEVQEVMEGLPTGKQAGPNRIPNAVYRCLSAHFAPKLAGVLREAINGAPLPPSMLEGDITLLYKKKDRTDVRNYRPLTMLNTDYKVYTKVLANRLKTVVHQFVTEAQKGFVPDVFIAECSMLLNLIEAWINEEPDDRKGIFLFLDMEKAFDRVSYSYLNEALDALGFGPRFARAVGLMYDVKQPPRRRIYANGYYSDWFDIKSGVAQGCPLSPLLFLVVAEGLRISLNMQTGFKGIQISGKFYKLSQFADDTTLIMRSVKEIKAVEAGLKRWCRATGMKENVSKREGLAMGSYRHTVMPEGIEWVKEGHWAVSLGVPIGNELDHAKWWEKKLEAVRELSKRWGGLFRTGYFGRNLVVQAMFLGRLRYWLYSIPMPRKVMRMVQDDADTLWWSKEPKLGGDRKRFRRFVAKKTAIGPRSKGGLGNLDWASHVDSFMSQWITRYVEPGEGSWKVLLDSFLLEDAKGDARFSTEGRGVVFCKLSRGEKIKLLKRLPKGAKYIKECFHAHWRLKVEQDPTQEQNIVAEPLWHNARFKLENVGKKEEAWLAKSLKLRKIQDIVDPETRRLRTRAEWRRYIRDCEIKAPWSGHHAAHVSREVRGHASTHFIRDTATRLVNVFAEIPERVMFMVRQTPMNARAEDGQIRILVRKGHNDRIVRCEDSRDGMRLRMLKKDAVGKLADTNLMATHLPSRVLRDPAWWSRQDSDKRIIGQYVKTFPLTEGWEVSGTEVRLDRLSIKDRTALLAARKMVPPAAEKAWELRLGLQFPWDRIWRLKSYYASPRDQFTWLRLMHRNLHVAGHRRDLIDTSCRACSEKETMKHLAECPIIRGDFWEPIFALIGKLGFTPPSEEDKLIYITLGCYRKGSTIKVITPDQAGLMFIAWRCLYAAIVGSRVDERSLNLEYAYKRTLQMCITRLRAYGEKWLLWSRKNQNTSMKSVIPENKRDRTVIRQGMLGTYHIAQAFFDEHERMRLTLAPAAQPPPADALRPATRRAPPQQQQPLPQQPRPIRPRPTPTRVLGPTRQSSILQYVT